MMLLFTDDPSDPTLITLVHHAPDRLRAARRRQGVEVEALPERPTEYSEASAPVLRLRDGAPVYDIEPIPPTRSEREQAEALSATLVARMVADETLDATELAGVAAIFPVWQVGIDVQVGDVLLWDGGLVECIQAHTTQQDWDPDQTPALWKVHRTDDGDEPIDWQPGLVLTTDDQVIHDGIVYDVIQAHTTQEGWEPPNTPALFEPV